MFRFHVLLALYTHEHKNQLEWVGGDETIGEYTIDNNGVAMENKMHRLTTLNDIHVFPFDEKKNSNQNCC